MVTSSFAVPASTCVHVLPAERVCAGQNKQQHTCSGQLMPRLVQRQCAELSDPAELEG